MLETICLVLLLAHSDDSNIRLIITLLNHGPRAPPYPNYNTSNNITDHNHRLGELTNVGLRQQYLLGRTIRQQYVHLAPIIQEYYSDNHIYARTAPTNPAYLSAYAILTGIYTPGTGEALDIDKLNNAIPPVEFQQKLIPEITKLVDMCLPLYTNVFPIHS